MDKLGYFLKEEPGYRLAQAQKAVYADMAESWQQVTVFPKRLRDMLESKFPLSFDFEALKSLDRSTLKALVKLEDELCIETVLMRHRADKSSRNTVCVSCQAGCPMGCIFCKTAKAGYVRNLSPFEITGQVLLFKYYLKRIGDKVSNVVFMGMGEPFLNYDNVISAVRILNDPDKFNIGARKISISTCGIPEAIERFSLENLQVNLAVSLNAPNEKLRTSLMPVNKKYPLDSLMAAVKKYISHTNRRVMFEYILIKDINDSILHAIELTKLLDGILCFVNLIPFNGHGRLCPPDKDTIESFRAALEKRGIQVTRRHSFGRDINAACGQLVYSDRE